MDLQLQKITNSNVKKSGLTQQKYDEGHLILEFFFFETCKVGSIDTFALLQFESKSDIPTSDITFISVYS